ncbi:regulatory protein RecX [Microbacterium lacus]|uniref:regulatory protein RecX n=1 Tax=Microbacterium lacus TaxID=415217 RepID=UPI000C2C68F7|nr:regulatory protein RecX [Microbacterium lacus]
MPIDEGDGGERLAPVTYLPGADRGAEPQRGQTAPDRAVASPSRKVTFSPEYWAEDEAPTAAPTAGPTTAPRKPVAISTRDELPDEDDEPGVDVDGATQALVKRLRTRQLSAKEARGMLAERGLDSATAEDVVADFEARGYLDDARLAEQLVYAATSRKGQGRRAISQTLSGRGIPREVVDAALDELPDDEAERALDFARQKARSMGSLDREAAVRRLHGQLARRGFGGSMAMTAAKQALDEAGVGSSKVRFR